MLPLFDTKQVTNEGDTDDSNTYYVNLCRPLVPMPGKNCKAGAWACKISGKKGDTPQVRTNLKSSFKSLLHEPKMRSGNRMA